MTYSRPLAASSDAKPVREDIQLFRLSSEHDTNRQASGIRKKKTLPSGLRNVVDLGPTSAAGPAQFGEMPDVPYRPAERKVRSAANRQPAAGGPPSATAMVCQQFCRVDVRLWWRWRWRWRCGGGGGGGGGGGVGGSGDGGGGGVAVGVAVAVAVAEAEAMAVTVAEAVWRWGWR